MNFDVAYAAIYVLLFIGQAACWYQAGKQKGISDGLVTTIDMLKEMMEKA